MKRSNNHNAHHKKREFFLSKTGKLKKILSFQTWYLSNFASGNLCCGKSCFCYHRNLLLLKTGGKQPKNNTIILFVLKTLMYKLENWTSTTLRKELYKTFYVHVHYTLCFFKKRDRTFCHHFLYIWSWFGNKTRSHFLKVSTTPHNNHPQTILTDYTKRIGLES